MHQHMPNYTEGQPEDATSYRTRMKDLNENPAIASYYFQKCWQVFFDHYLVKKFKIKDYWWRYEWQHRGSSHIHGFFWMSDAPSVDNLDPSDPISLQNFINFWDQHVSTWHPDKNCPPAAIHPSARLFSSLEDTKQELAEMLNRLQRHTYCKPGYCERKKKNSDEKYCRFGFPKQCRDESAYAREPGKAYADFLTRRNDEILNSYNAGFILGWRANIDFRPVVNKEAVIAYVAKYASKGETSSSSYEKTLQSVITHLQDSDAAGIAYQKLLSSFVAERDISGQETCHILLGCKLVVCSRLYRSLCVSPDSVSEEVDFAQSTTRCVGFFEKYKSQLQIAKTLVEREELHQLSLLEFATFYDPSRSASKSYTRRGQRNALPYVVQVWPHYQPDSDNAETYEKYCYARMILHHPFENPEDLLEGYDSWIDVYEQTCLNNPDHNHPDDTLPKPNEDNLQDNQSDGESILGDPEEIYQPQWAAEAGRHPGQNISFTLDNLGLRDLDKDYDWIGNSSNDLEVLTSATKWITDQVKESPNDDVQALPDVHFSHLKREQRKVFLQVMAYFKKIRSNDTPKPPPLRINIDGTAGTGKTFLIWTITHALRGMYSNEMVNTDPVVRLAPTGVAAFGIRGWTIHYGMAIPVKQGPDFQQLSSSSLQRHQTRWSSAKLLILDEKSMIGRVQLGRSDRRLRQAFPQKADEILGGLPALFFGDFAQLPPIGDVPLFSNKDYEGTDRASLLQQGKTVYNSLTKSVTLTQIFRQQGEKSKPSKVAPSIT